MADWLNVSDITPRIAYTATASQTVFTVPFAFFEEANLLVYKNGTLLTLATDYTTSGAENTSGGTVTLLTGATVGDQIMIVRELVIEQTTHIPPSGPLDVPAINIQISKLIAILQQLASRLARAVRLPDNVAGSISTTAPVAGEYLKWNTTADGIESAAVVTPSGSYAVATQSEAEGGALNTVLMTPLRSKQLITVETATTAKAVDSRATALLTTFAAGVNIIQTGGYATAGDGGGARYKRVGSAPAHAGKFQSAGGTWWEIAENVIDPRMLGVLADGSTDNTTTLQNAFDVVGALGGELRIGNTLTTGGIGFTGTITISNPMTIQGVGFQSSMLLGTGSATQGMFTVTSNNAVHFKDVWFNTTTANKTGGWGIKYVGSGGSPQNSFSTVQRCGFNNHQCALDFETAAYWTVRDCYFQLFSNVSAPGVVIVRNSASGDAGDSQLVGNWFFGGFSSTTYVNWQSSGGLRIARNKFLGNGTAGIAVNINAQGTTGTGLISIVDNSFDGPQNIGINLFTATAANILTNTTIVGNRFDGSPASAFITIAKTAGSTLGATNITGNNFTGPASTGVTVSLADTVLVDSNIFGGITAAVVLTTVSAAIVTGNLLGGGTLTPAVTSATVTIGTNK